MLNGRFQAVHKPKRHIAIDETFLLRKGRFISKQYIPNKHAHFGLKGYVLVESETGYICRYSLYKSKDSDNADFE